MKTSFLEEHKQNLKKLSKKELIQQVLIWIDISANMESQFNDSYEDLDNKYQVCESELIKIEKELEETQEALRINRNQLESYKEFESIFVVIRKRLTLYIDKSKEYENMSVWKFLLHKYRK